MPILKNKKGVSQLELHSAKRLAHAAIAISIVAILISIVSVIFLAASIGSVIARIPSTTVTTTVNTSFAHLFPDINQPLNSSELSIINNAPDQYFELAGEMYLNHTLNNQVGVSTKMVPVYIYGNKTSIIYLGSITCIYCGENRWAMAMALSRFGTFGSLYKGFSSEGDGDVPTLYWKQDYINGSTMDFGANYTSKYFNFIVFEDTDPITGGFSLQPMSVMQQEVNQSGNQEYINAFSQIVQRNDFSGTPYTVWGKFEVPGADAIDFGNTTPTSASDLQIAQMTHAQILASLSNPTSQFALTEYAAADLYIAMACASINNTAGVCALPAIHKIEIQNGYQ